MENFYFWDSEVWGVINLVAVLLVTMLLANVFKRNIPFLRKSLVPTSVLGGLMLFIVSVVYEAIAKVPFFNLSFFGGSGSGVLEVITYHALALGFIATTLKTNEKKFTKERTKEIFDTGVTTVSTYLLQGVVGLGITMLVSAFIMPELFAAAGVLLPFGYGQGTGQALNWGTTYQNDYNFVGGSGFGLTIAALGFLSASIGGVIYLNILKRKGRVIIAGEGEEKLTTEDVQSDKEIPMNGSMDKLTVQVALIALAYAMTYFIMLGLGLLLPGLKSVVYGFNFLFGVFSAIIIKTVAKFLHKKNIVKKYHRNNFILDRVSNFCFDLMVVAGIAAIRLQVISDYWAILLVLGVIGALITYFYNLYIARKLFPAYSEEQFLMMYGMLTGTASTGIILLRELDGDFKTPTADNLVYQNLPAIIFGFPMMLLANLAPKDPLLTLGILAAFFVVMNLILFRNQIFKRKANKSEIPNEPSSLNEK